MQHCLCSSQIASSQKQWSHGVAGPMIQGQPFVPVPVPTAGWYTDPPWATQKVWFPTWLQDPAQVQHMKPPERGTARRSGGPGTTLLTKSKNHGTENYKTQAIGPDFFRFRRSASWR